MTYDKVSFLAGLVAGKNMKGWPLPSDGAEIHPSPAPSPDPPSPTPAASSNDPHYWADALQVYKDSRPKDWPVMPTPAPGEMYALVYAMGTSLSATVGANCTVSSVEIGTVSDSGEFVPAVSKTSPGKTINISYTDDCYTYCDSCKMAVVKFKTSTSAIRIEDDWFLEIIVNTARNDDESSSLYHDFYFGNNARLLYFGDVTSKREGHYHYSSSGPLYCIWKLPPISYFDKVNLSTTTRAIAPTTIPKWDTPADIVNSTITDLSGMKVEAPWESSTKVSGLTNLRNLRYAPEFTVADSYTMADLFGKNPYLDGINLHIIPSTSYPVPTEFLKDYSLMSEATLHIEAPGSVKALNPFKLFSNEMVRPTVSYTDISHIRKLKIEYNDTAIVSDMDYNTFMQGYYCFDQMMPYIESFEYIVNCDNMSVMPFFRIVKNPYNLKHFILEGYFDADILLTECLQMTAEECEITLQHLCDYRNAPQSPQYHTISLPCREDALNPDIVAEAKEKGWTVGFRR